MVNPDFEHFHEVLWADREWPDDAFLGIYRSSVDSFRLHKSVRVNDGLDVIWGAVEHAAERPYTESVYINIAPMAKRPTARFRGGARDVYAVPALVVDVDLAHGTHAPDPKGRPHPTMEVWQELVAANPLGKPSLVVDTGGGLHAYWRLDEPLPATDETRELMKRWGDWWRNAANERGFFWDVGPSKNPDRVMRAPGTLNRKAEYAEIRARRSKKGGR